MSRIYACYRAPHGEAKAKGAKAVAWMKAAACVRLGWELMADYGICENASCELGYTHFRDLIPWLDSHPHKEREAPVAKMP